MTSLFTDLLVSDIYTAFGNIVRSHNFMLSTYTSLKINHGPPCGKNVYPLCMCIVLFPLSFPPQEKSWVTCGKNVYPCVCCIVSSFPFSSPLKTNHGSLCGINVYPCVYCIVSSFPFSSPLKINHGSLCGINVYQMAGVIFINDG